MADRLYAGHFQTELSKEVATRLPRTRNECQGREDPVSGKRESMADNQLRMEVSLNNSVWFGIDVCKNRLDVAIRPSGEAYSEANTEAAIKELTKKLKQVQPQLIGVEGVHKIMMFTTRPNAPN